VLVNLKHLRNEKKRLSNVSQPSHCKATSTNEANTIDVVSLIRPPKTLEARGDFNAEIENPIPKQPYWLRSPLKEFRKLNPSCIPSFEVIGHNERKFDAVNNSRTASINHC
jgi:hypothetical protein